MIGITREGIGQLVLPPVLEKEMRTTLRTVRFFLYILFCLIIGGAIITLVTESMGGDNLSPDTGLQIFHIMFSVQSFCIALAIPAYAGAALAGERQSHTFDLLRVTTLKPWEIVWGKFIALMSYIAIFLFAFMPLTALCFLFGGIDLRIISLSYVNLIIGAALLNAFCLMLSATSNSPIKTIITGYIFTFLFGFPWAGSYSIVAFQMAEAGVQAESEMYAFMFYYIVTALALLTLFFAAASCLIKPSSWNRSSSIRAVWAAVTLATLILFAFVSAWLPDALDDLQYVHWVGYILIPAVIAAIGFCGEPAKLSQRLITQSKKLPLALYFFAPGRNSARVFVRLTYLLASGAVFFIAWLVSGKPDKDLLHAMAAGFLFVHFTCSLSTAFRSSINSPKSRIFVVATLALLFFLPVISLLGMSGRTPDIASICPALGIAAASGTGDFNLGVYITFYVVASIIASLVSLACNTRESLPVAIQTET